MATGLLAGVDILSLHISDASVFVGVGGGLTGAHDAVTVGTVGIDATGVSLDYVTAVASGVTSAESSAAATNGTRTGRATGGTRTVRVPPV